MHHMHYRDILKNQLQRRQAMNPRYSLRSFAAKLGVSPSKISEVISGKKKLSVDRLEVLAKKLGLSSFEREIFVLSGELESSKNKDDLSKKLAELERNLKAEKTQQRNAWYFGAVRALDDRGLKTENLGITELQIENARRFNKRIRKLNPEREELHFEPTSLIKKMNESFEGEPQLQADFLFLTEDQALELNTKIKNLLKRMKIDNQANRPEDLRMIYFGQVPLIDRR
jgi:transcriptional regulator with XRE-family HTH domain